ncbi:MAG: hypothetical protein ABSD96_01635 [Candidatus Korobacteraceae bacterium]|jgi:hypothetical protein
MNIVELRSTVDHLLHIVLYLITAGVAIGGLITLAFLYMSNDRRATQQRRRNAAAVQAPLTEDRRPLSE